jgi:hypothetical protein
MISVYSCKKLEFKNDISGSWEILWAGGGLALTSVETNFSQLQLKGNNHYFMFRHDTLIAKGDYSIYKSNRYPDPYFEPYIVKFKKATTTNQHFSFPIDQNLGVTFVTNNTLIFSEIDFSDGFQYCFTRSK